MGIRLPFSRVNHSSIWIVMNGKRILNILMIGLIGVFSHMADYFLIGIIVMPCVFTHFLTAVRPATATGYQEKIT